MWGSTLSAFCIPCDAIQLNLLLNCDLNNLIFIMCALALNNLQSPELLMYIQINSCTKSQMLHVFATAVLTAAERFAPKHTKHGPLVKYFVTDCKVISPILQGLQSSRSFLSYQVVSYLFWPGISSCSQYSVLWSLSFPPLLLLVTGWD